MVDGRVGGVVGGVRVWGGRKRPNTPNQPPTNTLTHLTPLTTHSTTLVLYPIMSCLVSVVRVIMWLGVEGESEGRRRNGGGVREETK